MARVWLQVEGFFQTYSEKLWSPYTIHTLVTEGTAPGVKVARF